MNTRRVMTWVIFWCSVALALGALAWVSVQVVALERSEARSRISADRQETIRRALWRLDSTVAPLLAVEASRPTTAYELLEQSPYPGLGQVSVGTQTLNYDSYAKQYFNIPSASVYLTDGRVEDELASLYVSIEPERESTADRPQHKTQTASEAQPSMGVEVQSQKDSDYEARSRVAQMAVQNAQPKLMEEAQQSERGLKDQSDEVRHELNLSSSPDQVQGFGIQDHQEETPELVVPLTSSAGTLTPRWINAPDGPKLLLTRSATLNGQPVVQGVELDWDALRTDLTTSIEDVLPGAMLVPSAPTQGSSTYRMATIPVALIPPPMATITSWAWSPAKVGLVVTWIAIIATIFAVGIVLRAAIVLSERRGRFVSAVTHELRTPLTTFRLYSQMLADGMVSDEQVRKEYLSTLKRESERLTGIVENVLEYARLTRVRSGRGKPSGEQTLSPGALVARFRPALARRLSQSNLDLVASLDLESVQDRTITIDPHAVERIMMNLVENACKYAAPSDEENETDEPDTRVHLDVAVRDNTLEMLIADHGPGILPSEQARIFGEFQRGRRGLGNARSGLGLGLALSRGLAREMGGDLQLVSRRGHGAEFLLSIPLDQDQ